jgi:hypothetical protein
MLFVSARMRHIVFGLLILYKLISGKSPKPKSRPDPQNKMARQEKTTLSYLNIIILIKQPLQGHHTAKAVSYKGYYVN